MGKCFNITGSCIPEQHYMVDIHDRLEKIRDMIDRRDYLKSRLRRACFLFCTNIGCLNRVI